MQSLLRFESFMDDGDWHSRLMTALELAEQGTQNDKLRIATANLKELLISIDECRHTVSVQEELPSLIDPVVVLSRVQDALKLTGGKVDLLHPRTIRLTIVWRGSLEHVGHVAKLLLTKALVLAKTQRPA